MIILLNIRDYKINLYNCKNGHNNTNIFLHDYENFQYIDLSKIICNNCKKGNKSTTYNNEFYKCVSCNNNLCPLCKSIHNKTHIILNYDNKNYVCEKHNTIYIKYCKECKLNLCLICGKEHKNHSLANFEDIILSKEEYKNDINKLEIIISKLYIEIDNIIKQLIDIKYNIEIYHKIYNDLINNYSGDKLNYEKLQNINEFKVYNKIIINEINKIINEKNINNKFINLMDIYNRMNSEVECKKNEIKVGNNIYNMKYENKIKYIFEKDPHDLQFNMNINKTTIVYGFNDIFEVYTCYKDNKEYIALLNENFILDIFALLDNKKIISLYGHNKDIYTVRYFINNKNYDEYLISAGNEKAIIWDINNNYNIKFEFEKKSYSNYIYSCLIIFPHKNEENFFVYSNFTSIYINSLSKGKEIRYIDVDKCVYYLLSWYNKKKMKIILYNLEMKV